MTGLSECSNYSNSYSQTLTSLKIEWISTAEENHFVSQIPNALDAKLSTNARSERCARESKMF